METERDTAASSAILGGLGPQTTNMIPESSMGMGADTPAPLEGQAISSVGANSTTNQLAGQVPLEPRGVPEVVKESQRRLVWPQRLLRTQRPSRRRKSLRLNSRIRLANLRIRRAVRSVERSVVLEVVLWLEALLQVLAQPHSALLQSLAKRHTRPLARIRCLCSQHLCRR